MSGSPIPGFLKKRTATRQYNRSPRQISRDITVALDMQDETVLEHILIRAEDGEVIKGNDITSDLIKQLRNEGRNPTWYFRKTWLAETYGLRTNAPDEKDTAEQVEDSKPSDNDLHASADVEKGIVALMQETIRELKKDKELLTEQLRIKDTQLQASTERWKEANYISQTMNKRLEEMEKRFDILSGRSVDSRDSEKPTESKPQSIDVTPVSNVETTEKSVLREQATTKTKPARRTKTKRAAKHPNKETTKKSRSSHPAKATKAKSKWYNMPTFKKLLSRKK